MYFASDNPSFLHSHRHAFTRVLALAAVLVLSACTTPDGQFPRLGLKLAPGSLGEKISMHRHIKLERDGHTEEMDTALDVDDDHVELVGTADGEPFLSLNYDGKALNAWRDETVPSRLSAEDMLEDVQLALWPLSAIRACLPPGWKVTDSGMIRTLSLDGTAVAYISYTALPRWTGNIAFRNLRHKYFLTIRAASSLTGTRQPPPEV